MKATEPKNKSRSLTVVILSAMVLFLAGCFSDDSNPASPEPAMQEKTIAQIVSENQDFETLFTALKAANLDATLAGEGPYTVFAPTDAAFAALPEGALEGLLADPGGALSKTLLYHVVPGEVKAEQVVSFTEATSAEGSKIGISVADGKVYLNGSAMVETVDIMASNGVIHVINAVIMPPEPPKTIAQIAAGNDNFSTLVTALSAAGLVETLNGEGPFTVFAPTNAAFAALPEGALEAVLANPGGALTKTLLYHVVPGEVKAEQVVSLTEATSAEGSKIDISVADGKVYLNGSAMVETVDIMASNGVIHVINAVIMPPEPPKTIAQIAAGNDNFSTLVTALSAAGLVETLNGDGPYTVFAPTNAAFAALPEGALEGLLADPGGALTKTLLYHVVPGEVKAEQVVSLTEATSAEGSKIGISVADGKVYLNGSAMVETVDIMASNGVIHVINAVILPH